MNAGKTTAAVAMTFALTVSGWSWNDTGHMTVAELAWRGLDATQRTAVSDLLKKHPHYALLLTNGAPEDVDVDEWVFLKAATWPDMVRVARPGQPPKSKEITDYSHPEWHFVDNAYVWPSDSGHFTAADLALPVTNCVWAYNEAVNIMKDPHASAEDRAVRLCWILHLVGDVHQPLHATSMFSAKFPGGDHGGNGLAIAEAGRQPIKLHAYWDDLLGSGTSYHFIDTLADGFGEGTQYDALKMKDYKRHKTFPSWATESFAAAKAFAYNDGHLEFAPWRDFETGTIKAADVPVLKTSYAVNADNIARRRIALAGQRLADVLKTLF